MSILDDLRRRDLIEPVEPDETMARQWIGDARRHIEAGKTIRELDPAGAYVLAYDAARKSVAAVLLVTGFRVRSRPGSHQALAQFARHLGEEAREPALGHFDRLRRNRNRSEYGSRTFGHAEVEEALILAEGIHAVCDAMVADA